MKKKKILIISLCSALVLAGVITLIVCLSIAKKNKNKDKITDFEEKDATVRLEKPLNLEVSDDLLTWNKVDNAEEYVVYVNNYEYVTGTNNYSLKEIDGDRLTLSVKAKAKDYIDSVMSVEIIYAKNINAEEVSKMVSALNYFFVSYNDTLLDTELNDLATKLYKNGLVGDDCKVLLNNLDSLLKNLALLENIDKRDVTQDLVNDLLALYDLDINNVAMLSSARDIFSLYLSKEAAKLTTVKNIRQRLKVSYYDKDSLVKAYNQTIDNLNNLSSLSIQNISSTLSYVHLFEKEVKNIVATLASSTLVDDTFYNDLITLKDAINDILIVSMPLKVEFDDTTNKISQIYNGLFYEYLTTEVKSSDIQAMLINIYSENHYILSFLNTLSKQDIKYISTQLKNLYLSLDKNTRDDLEKSLSNVSRFNEVIEYFKTKLEENIDALKISDEFIEDIKACFNKDNPIEALCDYLDTSSYINVKEEDLNTLVDYFVSLLPEEAEDNPTSFINEILAEIKYDSFIEFEQERFLDDLDFTKIIQALQASSNGLVSVLDSLDIASYLKINRENFIEEIKRVILLKAPDVDKFNEESKEMSFDEICDKIGLRDEFNIDVVGLIYHIIDLSGLDINEESLKVVSNSLKDTYDYLLEMYPIINILSELTSIGSSFGTSVNIDEMTEEEAMKMLESVANMGFDYMALYNLNTYLTTRYAKFLAKYKAPYPNGRTIDKEIYKNALLKSACYYLFGVDAYYMDDIFVSSINISIKLIKMLINYNTYVNYVKHYYELYNSISSFDYEIFTLSQEEFDEFMNEFDQEIYYTYDVIKDLRANFIIDDSFTLISEIATLVDAKEYKFAAKVINFFNDLNKSCYDGINAYIDDIMEDYPDKSAAISDFYENAHALVDPIIEFVDKTVKRYEGITGEALYESLSIYLVQNSYNIIGFYKRDVVEQLGQDLNIIFEETGYDFTNDIANLCDYLDRLVIRMDDPMFFPNLIDDLKVIINIITVLTEQIEVISEDIETIDAIQSEELINVIDLDNSVRKLIADLRETYDLVNNDILTVSSSIDEMFETNLYDLSSNLLSFIDSTITKLDESIPDISTLEQSYMDELEEELLARLDFSSAIEEVTEQIVEFFENIDLTYFVDLYNDIKDSLYNLYLEYFG